MKYVHYFETDAQYQQKRNNDYEEPWVSYTKDVARINYNKTEEEKLLGTPFTIEALGGGNITWSLRNKTVQYSKNGGTWETMNSATTISVNTGDEVQFKGTNTNYSGNTISATAQFNVKGNIMSLTNGNEFETAVTVGLYCFENLFKGCGNLVSASNLKLPATTLATECYCSMFQDCTSLTKAPELPATTVEYCCYYTMFQGCSSLTKAPELPAATLARYCYHRMFIGCTSLNYIKCLATDISAQDCTNSWVYNVSNSGTFVKAASMTSWPRSDRGIPEGWTVQDA